MLIRRKNRTFNLIDFVILVVYRVNMKKIEKTDKSLDLAKKLLIMKVMIIPVAVCALKIIPNSLKKRILYRVEAKLWIFQYNNKRVILLNTTTIFFFFSIIVSIDLRNDLHAFKKFFRHFILFLLNSIPNRTNILMGSCICFVFSNAPYSVIKGVKVWA